MNNLAVRTKGIIQLRDSWQHRSPLQEGGGHDAVAGKKKRSTTGKEEGNEKQRNDSRNPKGDSFSR